MEGSKFGFQARFWQNREYEDGLKIESFFVLRISLVEGSLVPVLTVLSICASNQNYNVSLLTISDQ